MESEEEEGGRLCYKQRAEKPSAGEITLMEWSPTMDVIALAFADFSVSYKTILIAIQNIFIFGCLNTDSIV